jgi:hypothetical protein
MLRDMGNSGISGNSLLARATDALSARLPDGWSVSLLKSAPKGTGYQPDALLSVRAPDGSASRLVVEAKRGMTAASAASLAPQLNAAATLNDASTLLVADYLSPIARDRLMAAGVSYLDFTGNIRIALNKPGLFIELRGADTNPAPTDKGTRSLKGGAAARIVRSLCDNRPPIGIRELAQRTGTNPGYVSRVVALLEQEDVIGRDKSGRLITVKWQDLLRRWAQDYALMRSNRFALFLEPRGTEAFTRRLRSFKDRYAITGSRAVPRGAEFAPARTITCYVPSIEQAATALDLRPIDSGGNVLLVEPFDQVVWERMREGDSLSLVAVSQCAVDLMTGTGREPSEAEALLRWMEENEREWRA